MRQHYIIILLSALLNLSISGYAQNSLESDIPYQLTDGKIGIDISVDGVMNRFILSTSEELSSGVYRSFIERNKIEQSNNHNATLKRVSVGESIFFPTLTMNVIDDSESISKEISGVLGMDLLKNYVLTINSKEQTITISSPYKPSYIDLKNRTNLTTHDKVQVHIGNQPIEASLDINAPYLLALSNEDSKKIAPSDKAFRFANHLLKADSIVSLPESSIGQDILSRGVISIDYGKRRVYFQSFETLKKEPAKRKEVHIETEDKIIHLSRDRFVQKVFDYRKEKEWKFLGEKPAIIDFWAEWCGPCKKLAPILDELSEEYKAQITFYKLNIDEEKEIAGLFNVKAIPLLMYIPLSGEPVWVMGVKSKEQIKQKIDETFYIKK